MSTSDVLPRPKRHGSKLYFMYLGALAIALLGNLGIRTGGAAGWLPPAGQFALAVVSAAPLLVAAVVFWRLLRGDLDEMLQRVVLEGMAFAFVIYLPVAALWMNLAASGLRTPRLDAADVVLTPAVLVALGIALAIRRYA